MPHSSVLSFKGPDSASRAATAVGALVVAVLLVVVATSIWQYRHQARESALAAAEDLAFALAVHAQQAIDSADYVADAVQRSIERREYDSSEEFRPGYAGEAEHQWLRSRHTSFSGISVVTVVDAQGRLVNTSFSYPPPVASFDELDAFTAARDRPATPYISAPQLSPVTGRRSIYLSRPLKDPQDRFMGAVLVGLSPKYFSDFYTVLRMDRSAPRPDVTAMTLLRSDRTVMARAPYDEQVLARQMSATGAYADIPGTAGSTGPTTSTSNPGTPSRARRRARCCWRGRPCRATR